MADRQAYTENGENPTVQAQQTTPRQYTSADITDMLGLVPPTPRSALVRELALFLERPETEIDDLVATAAVGDELEASHEIDNDGMVIAREIARLIHTDAHLETIRVMASVAEHYGKSTALVYLGGLGHEAIALARIGLQVTQVQPPGPVAAFARWRFQARALDIHTITLPEAPKELFDLIASFGPPAQDLDPALVLAQAATLPTENGLVFVGPNSEIGTAHQFYPGALVKSGLRRAIDCGHTVVYVRDNPPSTALPVEQQIEEVASVLRAGSIRRMN